MKPGRGAVAATVAAALGLGGPAARGQPPVWVVHGPRGDLVLFGSLHMLPRGLDWRPPVLSAALSRAREVWFELPRDEATDVAARRLLDRRGRLPAGQTLWTRLDAAQADRVRRAAAAAGVPPDELTGMRPWRAELTLALAQDAKAGAAATNGVEADIQNSAPPNARRKALETVDEQVDFLAGGDEAEQIAALEETASEIVTEPDHYAHSLAEWLTGDLAGLRRDDLDRQKAVTPGAYRRLVAERNRRWAPRLAAKAKRAGVTVVVVGVAHLIGPDGLPSLLRARGLIVEGP